jgi:hypothetical protein
MFALALVLAVPKYSYSWNTCGRWIIQCIFVVLFLGKFINICVRVARLCVPSRCHQLRVLSSAVVLIEIRLSMLSIETCNGQNCPKYVVYASKYECPPLVHNKVKLFTVFVLNTVFQKMCKKSGNI